MDHNARGNPSRTLCKCHNARLYNPHSINSKHKNVFGKWQKQLLVATLDYLGTSGQDQFTKLTCINNLIYRTHNQLPDTCNVKRNTV